MPFCMHAVGISAVAPWRICVALVVTCALHQDVRVNIPSQDGPPPGAMPAPPATVVKPSRRRLGLIIGGVVAMVVVALGILLVSDFLAYVKPPPDFPSLADSPDPLLKGTVAYFTTANCVRIVAAAGSPSEEVLCLEEDELGDGPQLAWLADGRLEVTMFRWPVDAPIEAFWQKRIDVETGVVQDVPQDEVPEQPDPTPVPAVGPDGEEVTATTDDGHLEVTLTDESGTRTLLTAEGGTQWGVSTGGEPVWSPSGGWILFSDGRLLLTTVDNPTTRVLVAESWGSGSWASAGIRVFAVTDAELVGPGD